MWMVKIIFSSDSKSCHTLALEFILFYFFCRAERRNSIPYLSFYKTCGLYYYIKLLDYGFIWERVLSNEASFILIFVANAFYFCFNIWFFQKIHAKDLYDETSLAAYCISF